MHPGEPGAAGSGNEARATQVAGASFVCTARGRVESFDAKVPKDSKGSK
jgi:hypothetical protein